MSVFQTLDYLKQHGRKKKKFIGLGNLIAPCVFVISCYLWCHVVWCPTESVSCFVQVDLELAHSKIGYPDVTLEVQEQIVQFQIPGRRQNVQLKK